MEAAALVQGAIERFAQELAYVVRRFLKARSWRKVERIAVGGGFRASRAGELAIWRTNAILRESARVGVEPIRFDPDDAGLIGALHLAPPRMFADYDCILAVDIGGTNLRCGLVEPRRHLAVDFSRAGVRRSEIWHHAEENVTRQAVVAELVRQLKRLIARAKKERRKLAPFIGIACPGVIRSDGSIAKGAQNLPRDWESESFNLPRSIAEAIPQIGERDIAIVMHNDAVVQGLSQRPFMRDVKRWGALTIGTGLGNACYRNLRA